jgi:hypothetical protein
MAWGLVAALAAIVLGGSMLLIIRLRPYWVARYRGAGAHLRGVSLRGAALASANLQGADLRDADLRGANLQGAFLGGAELAGADFRGAHLERVWFCPVIDNVEATSTAIRLGKWPLHVSGCLISAHYDAHTRWPDGFDPRRHGAVLVR